MNEDIQTRILLLANSILETQDIKEFEEHLSHIDTFDVVTSPDLRSALRKKARFLFCILRRTRMEGRAPPILDWIVSFQDILLESASQNEMRRLESLDEIYTEFVHILNSRKSEEKDIQEAMRCLSSTTLLADFAWHEIYKSPLSGVAQLLENTTELVRVITNAFRIGTILRNSQVMDALNTRAEDVLISITGRRNPEMAVSLLGALTTLSDNPWCIGDEKGLASFSSVKEELRQGIIGRFASAIPRKEKLVQREETRNNLSAKVVEDLIRKAGWVFTRNFLMYHAAVKEFYPDMLFPVAFSQEPMGRINAAYVLYCLRKDIPLPYQILESGLGRPNEYVLDIDILESEMEIPHFEADCPPLKEYIKSTKIREHHLVNGRSGLRLDETYLGAKGLIRALLDREDQIGKDIASRFLRDLVLDSEIPITIKKRAKESLQLIQRR